MSSFKPSRPSRPSGAQAGWWLPTCPSSSSALTLAAAACWAAYILLTQRFGDRVTGLKGLAVHARRRADRRAHRRAHAVDPRDLVGTVDHARPGRPEPGAALRPRIPRPAPTDHFRLGHRDEPRNPPSPCRAASSCSVRGPGLAPAAGIACVVVAGIGATRNGDRRTEASAATTPADAQPCAQEVSLNQRPLTGCTTRREGLSRSPRHRPSRSVVLAPVWSGRPLWSGRSVRLGRPHPADATPAPPHTPRPAAPRPVACAPRRRDHRSRLQGGAAVTAGRRGRAGGTVKRSEAVAYPSFTARRRRTREPARP